MRIPVGQELQIHICSIGQPNGARCDISIHAADQSWQPTNGYTFRLVTGYEIVVRALCIRNPNNESVIVAVRRPGNSVKWEYELRPGHDLWYQEDSGWFISNPTRFGVPLVDARDYPSKCTRCGQDCYLGMFEVAHRDEAAAASCPAPRVPARAQTQPAKCKCGRVIATPADLLRYEQAVRAKLHIPAWAAVLCWATTPDECSMKAI